MPLDSIASSTTKQPSRKQPSTKNNSCKLSKKINKYEQLSVRGLASGGWKNFWRKQTRKKEINKNQNKSEAKSCRSLGTIKVRCIFSWVLLYFTCLLCLLSAVTRAVTVRYILPVFTVIRFVGVGFLLFICLGSVFLLCRIQNTCRPRAL